MSIDLTGSLRRLKPQRVARPLLRRDDAQLPFVTDEQGVGGELLLDTNVYLDVLQGRTPPEVDRLLELRINNHSTVVLAELTHLFGRLDPADVRTKPTLAELRSVLDGIPSHRLTAPSSRAFGEAGMLAGLAVRLTGRLHGLELLNDALLLLHALETGCILLTRNMRDFDLLQQLVPASQILVYRQNP